MPEGVVGPVQAKLHSFPPLRKWVFGAWGEASVDSIAVSLFSVRRASLSRPRRMSLSTAWSMTLQHLRPNTSNDWKGGKVEVEVEEGKNGPPS